MPDQILFNRITDELRKQGRSQVWLSEQLGLLVQSVSKWCTNERQPRPEAFLKIAHVLGVEPGELLVRRQDIPADLLAKWDKEIASAVAAAEANRRTGKE